MNSSMRSAAGITFIELMISIAIGASIIAGVVQMYANSTRIRLAFEGQSRIQESARFVFSQLEKDILQSGASGCIAMLNSNHLNRIKNILGNESTAHQKFDMTQPVSGSEQTGLNNSDTLVLRFLDKAEAIPVRRFDSASRLFELESTHPAYYRLERYQVVYAANCSRSAAFMITNEPTHSGTIRFASNQRAPSGVSNSSQFNTEDELALGRYFATADINATVAANSLAYVYGGDSLAEYKLGNSENGECTSASPQFCVLLRNDEELAEGIAGFQIEFGWETAQNFTQYGNWNNAISQNSTNTIDRIKVTLTINSINQAPSVNGERLMSKEISREFSLRNQLPTY